MKARDWQRILESMRRLHGKTVYTVTELVNLSGSAPHALNVELSRLRQQGIIQRYAHGRYGLPDGIKPETLLPHLDSGAYITADYALCRHNLITQAIVNILCFTNRRHNRSRVRTTAAGQLTFVCVQPPIYAPPPETPIAPPEQALCDLLLTLRRHGLDPRSLYTFRHLDRLNPDTLKTTVARYPATVGRAVEQLISPAPVPPTPHASP